MLHYVVISGNIGSGKSTLTARLSEHLGWRASYEPVADNPYLDDFYQDKASWSFHSQIYFLTERLRIYQTFQQYNGVVIQDRSLYEDAEIFAKHLYLNGFIAERDYKVYLRLYSLISAYTQPPELLVYLKSPLSVLQKRIAERGRNCERLIDLAYLQGLNELYDRWIEHYSESSVLTIDTGEIDIVARPTDLERVVELIREAVKDKQDELFEGLT